MKKIKKLIFKPKQFIKDSKVAHTFKNYHYLDVFYSLTEDNNKKPLIVMIGFNPWKRSFMQEYFPNNSLLFVRGKTPQEKIINALKSISKEERSYKVYIWSYKCPPRVYKYLVQNNIKIHRVEDGFIRSIGLGSKKTKPLSLAIDDDSLYFNAFVESKLEKLILSGYKKCTNEQLKRASALKNTILENKITKYNFINKNVSQSYIDSLLEINKKIVLVIGQVEDDMSIIKGTDRFIDNLDLIELAKNENPDALIVFKGHPDIIEKKRKNKAAESNYNDIIILRPDIGLHDILPFSEHIYTITSLAGFEALLYGKKVTCLGAPFYSGWGLTDDRGPKIERRSDITLSIEKLIYFALIEYPKYLHDTPEKTIDIILHRKDSKSVDFNDRFIFYNTNTRKVDIDSVLDKAKEKKIAFITNNSDIPDIYLALNHYADTDVYAVTNIIDKQIRARGLIPSSSHTYINKHFMQPLSKIENDAIALSMNISNNYRALVYSIVKNSFDSYEAKEFARILAENFEDIIFNECVLYLSLMEIASNYEHIVYYDNFLDPSPLFFIFRLPVFEEKVLIATKSSNDFQKAFIEYASKKIGNKTEEIQKYKIDNLTLQFSKTWNSAKYDHSLNKKDLSTSWIVLCANLTGKNYAYYPSAEEVMRLSGTRKLNIKLLPQVHMNEERYNEYKRIVFDDTVFIQDREIIPTFIRDTMKSNKRLGTKLDNKISESLNAILINLLIQKFPDELVKLLTKKILKISESFSLNSALYFEMLQNISSTAYYVTTMERTLISRLYTLACKKSNIQTIGIQPQVISASKRYRKPMVDKMLVIDPLQEENIINQGYNKKQIFKVGSANLRKHIDLIQSAEDIDSGSYKNSVLFIMQHSMPETMLTCIESLQKLPSDIHVYLKPHPMQEKVLISKAKQMIHSNPHVTLLEPDDDTYAYIKHANIVVGIFSSALYEAILAEKDVIILKVEELDASIDFSREGTCIEVYELDKLLLSIKSFLNNTEEAKKVRDVQRKYIENNAYIYTTEKIEMHLFSNCINKGD